MVEVKPVVVGVVPKLRTCNGILRPCLVPYHGRHRDDAAPGDPYTRRVDPTRHCNTRTNWVRVSPGDVD